MLGYDPMEFAATLRSIAEGEIDVAPLITGEVDLDGVPGAFDALANPFERAQRRARSVFRSTPRPLRAVPNQAHGRLLLCQAQRHVRQWRARQAESASGRATGSVA